MTRKFLLALLPLCLLVAGCTGKTTGASSVTATSAQLNAEGRCQNSCDVRFRYRLNDGRWNYTPYRNYPSSGSSPPVPINASIGNLSPGSAYRYQACGNDRGVQPEACVGPGGSTPATSFNTPASSAPRVKLMTYNVEHFAHGSLTQIKNDIVDSGATIVALQEVRRFNLNEADRLVDALGWNTGGTHAYFQGWQDSNTCNPAKGCNEIGVGIISKFPFAEPSGWVYLEPHDPGLDRKLIRSTVQVGSKKIRVYATWLATDGFGVQYQRDQLHNAIEFIRNKIAALGLNQVVFMGDLNLPLSSDNLRNSFDTLTAQGYHDWKVDRVPAGDNGNLTGNVCTSKDPTGRLYLPCTFSNYDPNHLLQSKGDKRDYIWAMGYPLAGGSVGCYNDGCHSDHRSYWTEIVP